MQKHKVRPVLVESKEPTNIWWSGHKIYYNRTPEEPKTSCYQLILISLEDEKIEVGDKCYCGRENRIIINQYHTNIPLTRKKIVATQHQLSPQLIQQLVDEYNNGGMKDFKIEMEDNWYVHKPSGKYYEDEPVKMKVLLNWGDFKSKLTNGFVTPVKKEPILYTEEEVKELVQDYLGDLISTSKEILFERWFEQNKKK